MDLSKWIKRQIGAISIAIAGVEKNALGQNKEGLTVPVTQERKHTQGSLMDNLVNGVVTAEVEALRWRTYKVLESAKTYTTKIVGYDAKGKPITEQVRYDPENALRDIKVDAFDSYPLQMVIDNSIITTNIKDEIEKLDDDHSMFNKLPTINYNEKGIAISATHGEFKIKDQLDKHERPIKIDREYLPNFQLENFATKLNVRGISETERLLEFYILKYADEDNRTTRLLISEIKKAILNPRVSSMLDIKEVGFITYKALGAADFLEYQYKISSFDKIIEFNSYYIIKFKAEVTVNGRSIVEEFRDKALDERYEKKERKKEIKRTNLE
jgi:hypothetical protein